MKISDEAVHAALAHYSEGGCMGLAEHERREVTVDMLTAALPFLQGVKVKGLEWESVFNYGLAYRATTPIGIYSIYADEDSAGGRCYCVLHLTEEGANTRYSVEIFSGYEEYEDIQKAAQADYEARISSAIEVSAGRAALLEEAARAAEGNSPLFDHQSALAECRDCESGFHNGRVVAAAAIRALSSPDHADDLAVDCFAIAMKQKLAKKREEGRGGWENKEEYSAEYLSYLLIQHIWKGDPVDIANLAMMLQQRGERVVIDSETSSIIPDHAGAGKVEGDGWLPIDETSKSGRIVRIAYNRDDVTMADAFYRDGKWHAACVFYRSGVGKPPYEFREHKVLENLVFAYRNLPSAPASECAE